MEQQQSAETIASPHVASVLKNHIFSEHHPQLVNLIGGLTTGSGVAITVEWNKHFETIRHVPIWETFLIASTATTAAMWATLFILNWIYKWRT